MKSKLARNIKKYRKEHNLTQEDLAEKLNISFQAISKWETEQSMPDITLLPTLANILRVSPNKLLGYIAFDEEIDLYESMYNQKEYYWGVAPSKMCLKILEIMPPTKHLKVLDIGCGEGKDAVFLAKNGYDVTAFDISSVGIEKTKKLAKIAKVKLTAFKADVLDYRLESNYDILYSSGVFHIIKPELRGEILFNYKSHTNKNGINAFNTFISKPYLEEAPDMEVTATKWISGELFTHYHDWSINECDESVFDCYSSGIPHKHALNSIIATKI